MAERPRARESRTCIEYDSIALINKQRAGRRAMPLRFESEEAADKVRPAARLTAPVPPVRYFHGAGYRSPAKWYQADESSNRPIPRQNSYRPETRWRTAAFTVLESSDEVIKGSTLYANECRGDFFSPV